LRQVKQPQPHRRYKFAATTEEEEMAMRKSLAFIAFVLAMAWTATAAAAEIEVKMLNKSTEGAMVFEPALVKIQPGDSVKFLATDKGHNAEAIKAMLPEGAATFAGKLNEDIVVTFDKPGVYGYKCAPHYGMGMVGIVVVGSPENSEQAKVVVHPGRAKQIFAKLLDALGARTAAAQ
jgi:pseudoazurin